MFVVGEWEGAIENFRLEEEEEPFDLKFFLFFFFGGCRLKKYTLAKLHFTFFFNRKVHAEIFI